MSSQAAVARTPGAKRAGTGEYHFELAKVNHIKGGPAYSTAEGEAEDGQQHQDQTLHFILPVGSLVGPECFARAFLDLAALPQAVLKPCRLCDASFTVKNSTSASGLALPE